jgi:NTE family protein
MASADPGSVPTPSPSFDPTTSPSATAAAPGGGTALCLSGGGYRAMLFHVGTVCRLNHAGWLRKLTRVSSVSGGSITAATLGMLWQRLDFDGNGNGIVQNLDLFVNAVRAVAGRTIDEGSVLGGLLLPGSIGERVTGAYDRHVFHGATLGDLPDEKPGVAPRFVINATNVQSGAVFRFSKPYVGDYRIGRSHHPGLPLAVAVAASSAFPPVLSPIKIEWDGPPFEPDRGSDLNAAPYTTDLVLTDGGVYDNMGLETVWKSHRTVLISDAGLKMSAEPEPRGDWAQHSLRVLDLIDNQVRSLRRREGAYWGVRTDLADYGLPDPMPAPFARTSQLAAVKTRLKRLDDETQERLINWGYAACDAAMRRYVEPTLKRPPSFLFARGV